MTLDNTAPSARGQQPFNLTFQMLLRHAQIPLETMVALRHTPPEPNLMMALPSWVLEKPELFEAYQSIQGPAVAAMLKRADVLASFIGQDLGHATFAGLWRIGDHRPAEPVDLATPAFQALQRQGARIVTEGEKREAIFQLTPMAQFAEWIGRLVVDWPARGINWKLRLTGNPFVVRALERDSRFKDVRPDWTRISLTWSQLQDLPRTWRAMLLDARAIYYIFDERRRLGYVGSASGSDNLLGRWMDYAKTGHGGNVGLKDSRPEDLRFSILEDLASTADRDEVLKRESGWMQRLRTLTHGLNGGSPSRSRASAAMHITHGLTLGSPSDE